MSQANALERDMLALINAERAAAGADPVELELRLNVAAEVHSQWMLDTDMFQHAGPGGNSPGDRMRDAGFVFNGSWAWSENIAGRTVGGAPGYDDEVIALHQQLVNSSGHYQNMVNPNVDYIGIGIEVGEYNGRTWIFVTQNYAKTSASVQLDPGNGGGGGNPGNTNSPTSGDDQLVMDAPGNLNALGGDDTIDGSGGNDEIRGSSGWDEIDGNAGHDKLRGGGGKDTLNGGSGNDTLYGGSNSDELLGSSGNDRLVGGDGNDSLDGGTGDDKLVGKSGSDVFIFSSGDDVITDFDISEANERIDLSSASGISSYSDLVANHMSQSGDDVLIEDAIGNSLSIRDVDLAELGSSDFIF